MNRPYLNAYETLAAIIAACLIALLLHHLKPATVNADPVRGYSETL